MILNQRSGEGLRIFPGSTTGIALGLGLFLFLRSDYISPVAALFGAAAWMGTTKLIGYVGDGQVSSVFALAWYPWLLLANGYLAKWLTPRNAIMSAGILSIIILIDIRWGFFAGMFSLTFLLSQFQYRKTTLCKRFI